MTTKKGNYQFLGPEFLNENGQWQRNIARFDVLGLKKGELAHLNLEIQINGVSQPGDLHTPIEPLTIRPGDFER